MITRGVKEFVSRDWAAARAAKDDYWAHRIATMGALEAFRIADELRRRAREQDPAWPRPEDRQQDFVAHVRLTELLARADAVRRQ
jgi:hypothetical protein